MGIRCFHGVRSLRLSSTRRNAIPSVNGVTVFDISSWPLLRHDDELQLVYFARAIHRC